MNAGQAGLTVQCKVHFQQRRWGTKQMAVGAAPPPAPQSTGRIPRIARLMALAIRFEGLVQRGEVRDYADLARLGHVSRARVTQIINMLNLAPDIQEAILCLPPIEHGRDPIRDWQVRPIAGEADWGRQRRMWRALNDASCRC